MRGTVVGVAYRTVDDLEKYRGKLKGAIVLLGASERDGAPDEIR